MAQLLVFVGALTRLFPHPANVAPITAIALFGGSHLPRKQAIGVPLLAMILSDFGLYFILGYPVFGWGTLFVYGSIAAIALIGTILARHKTFKNVAALAVASMALFFVVTNFGAWLTLAEYPKTAAGLVSAYVAAIPYLRNSILGDAAWITILFGAYALVRRWTPRPSAQAAKNISVGAEI